MRKWLFNLHWLLGISAGLVIAVVGLTGGMLSLQPQILQWLNPGIITIAPQNAAQSPEELLDKVQQQVPEKSTAGLTLYRQPTLAAEVRFRPEKGQRRGESQYLNPYSGELLGQPQGRQLFIDIMRLHRWLLAGDVGKQIVGAATIILIFLCLSGLYFRWPKGKKRWQPGYWLAWRPGKSGRPFWWQLHAVIGTWLLPLYLLACLTGLYWSYEWYRDGLYQLSGVERPQRSQSADNGVSAESTALDAYWSVFENTVTDYKKATLQLPVGDTFTVVYLPADARHERANNLWQLDTDSMRVIQHKLFSDKPLNERLMSSILPLHSGEYFGWPGLIAMMLASLLMPVFFISGWYLYLSRKKRQRITIEKNRAAAPGTA
ncbi:MAG: PepSY-associated TM helix domain-containing protein [Methylophaga sp.]